MIPDEPKTAEECESAAAVKMHAAVWAYHRSDECGEEFKAAIALLRKGSELRHRQEWNLLALNLEQALAEMRQALGIEGQYDTVSPKKT